ncbi:MAG: lipocalin family protein [Cyclobacteriaceae bacterium]|jgi:hypothetical protein
MKLKNSIYLFLLSELIGLNSCNKDVTLISKAEEQGKLLAGEKGGVKVWKITRITAQSGADPEQQLNLGACFTDNRFTFKNNGTQDYEATEGTTPCSTSDPSLIEKGAWSFTSDGTVLLVLSGEVYSRNGMFNFTALDAPSTVLELTGTSLKLKMILKDATSTTTFQLSFVPA